jgi:hypothetical protein
MRTTGSAAPCALAQHRAGEFDAVDELLAQHVGVVAAASCTASCICE